MRFARGIFRRRLFRLSLAAVLGFTSLAHGPSMTLRAAAAQAPCHGATVMHDAAMHDAPVMQHAGMHHADATQRVAHEAQLPSAPPPSKNPDRNVCPMPNCFVMVTPVMLGEPVPTALPSRYELVLMRVPQALAPDPTEPPPRLSA
jgi:hypothetical protein